MNRELFLKKVVAAIAILVTVVSCRGELAEEGWVGEGSTRAASSALSGDLDTSFGVGGKVQTVFPQQVPNTSVVQALVRQPDGKILAGGKSGLAGIVIPAPFSVFAIARYNTDGSLDTSFGTGGRVTTGWGTNMAHVRSLALQPDGKILAGGLNANDFVANYILSRYLPNGALDPSFGVGGKVSTNFLLTGVGSGIRQILVQADGKILALGAAGGGGSIARYNPNGSLDETYGEGGKVESSFSAGVHFFDGKLLDNGKLLVAGTAFLDFMVARYNTDGSLDTAFGNGGFVTTDFNLLTDIGFSLELTKTDGTGKMIVAGVANGADPFGQAGNQAAAIARYNADGSLDASFGNGGKVTIDPTLVCDGIKRLRLHDGKLFAAGYAGDVATCGSQNDPVTGAFTVWRFNDNGSLDASWGQAGTATTTFGGDGEAARDLLVLPNGQAVAAGAGKGANGLSQFSLAKYLN